MSNLFFPSYFSIAEENKWCTVCNAIRIIKPAICPSLLFYAIVHDASNKVFEYEFIGLPSKDQYLKGKKDGPCRPYYVVTINNSAVIIGHVSSKGIVSPIYAKE